MALFINTTDVNLVLNGTTIKDFVAGDIIVLSFPNPDTNRVMGSNGSVAISKRTDANVGVLALNILRYSESHDFFNNIISSPIATVVNGSLQQSYMKNDIASVRTFTLFGGSITTKGDVTINDQDGNEVQPITIEFRTVTSV